MQPTYDFIAIGLGPFNLSLACLTESINDLNGLFLEQRSEFNWHPGLMIDGVHLQTPFMSDLVTLADPTNPYSYLNYAKLTGNLYQFYIREDFFLLRKEYNQYCQWASKSLSNVQFERQVVQVDFNESESLYCIFAKDSAGNTHQYFAKHLVLGTGPVPNYTAAVDKNADDIIHSGQYLANKDALTQAKKLVIVGSGQSAAEIYYDLLTDIRSHNYELTWVTRAPRFFPLEYSKLTLEMTSPNYVDYYYDLPQVKKDALIANQKHLYKGINSSLINEIYDLLYQLKLDGDVPTRLLTNSELKSQSGHNLAFQQTEAEHSFTLEFDKLVMATGFSYQDPAFLSGIECQINRDNTGRFAVARDYSIDKQQRIFVQNAELHTHGFVTPDLGMACYRNSQIINQILGYAHYQVETHTTFQEFLAPEATPCSEGENV